uniref:Uncharacterized protein n=1 Tax=Ectopseudomonas oleovorans TaxID=301 RepID=A0A653B608_ECTOL
MQVPYGLSHLSRQCILDVFGLVLSAQGITSPQLTLISQLKMRCRLDLGAATAGNGVVSENGK